MQAQLPGAYSARRGWYHLHFPRARYFPSRHLLGRGQQEFNFFNVDRTLYEDENNTFPDNDMKYHAVHTVSNWRQKEHNLEAVAGSSLEEYPEARGLNPDELVNARVGLARGHVAMWKKRWDRGNCDVGRLS